MAMLRQGFSVPTILALVLLAVVLVLTIYKYVSLRKKAADMKAKQPGADAPALLIGLALDTIQVMVLLDALFILLVVSAGSFMFSMMRDRRISVLGAFWIAVFSPLVAGGVIFGSNKLSQILTAHAVGAVNRALPPAKVVEAATTNAPASTPTGVEGYTYPQMLKMI